jgi:F420H(2)-dependent quinone reductase
VPIAQKAGPDRKEGERLLKESQEVDLTTIGRKTNKARSVELWFVYDDGVVWLMTGRDRNGPTSHWARNLQVNPEASLKIGRTVFRARLTKVEDAELRLSLLMQAFRAKYGDTTVSQFYGGTPRMPIALRIAWPRER